MRKARVEILVMFARKSVAILVLGTLAALTAACRTYPVDTDWDRNADFASLGRYAWTADEPLAGQDPRVDSDLLDARLRSSIDDALAVRGYVRADPSDADFLVRYRFAVDKQLEVQSHAFGGPYGYGRAPGPIGGYASVREYQVGSLVIDIVDIRGERLVWRGSTPTYLLEARTPEQRDERAREAVDAILAKFPPS